MQLVRFILIGVFLGVCEALGECDPLVPDYCGLPLPNSFYMRHDASSLTGLRTNFSTKTFPENTGGDKINPKDWNTFDGSSPFPFIVTYFPGEIDDSNLPTHWNISESLQLEISPTLLYDVQTGKFVAHFSELDRSMEGAKKHALTIWPAQRLSNNARYIVAIRNLHTTGGDLVKPSEAFLSLRDNKTTTNPDIEERRKLFEEIFSLLNTHGEVPQGLLQLAWDFSTASEQCLTDRVLHMRDDAMKRIGDKGEYRVVQVEDNYSKDIYRKLSAVMKVPYYTTTTHPGARLVLDDQGLPVYQGLANATFTVLIPHSVANGTYKPNTTSSPMIVQYGHGLFGSQSEVTEGYLQEQANRYGYVMTACDWWGMSSEDKPGVVAMMSYFLSDFAIIPERLSQGVLNALTLMRITKTSFVQDKNVIFNGQSVIVPDHSYYYGNSLGGVMGSVYMATTTDVKRGTLGVAGGPFGLLLPRSQDFQEFEVILRRHYPDPVHIMMWLHYFNLQWSRTEPNGYMSSITDNPLPNTPSHRVIMHYGLGDAQVSILGLYSLARSVGVVMFENHVLETFKLPSGNTVVEKLYGFSLVSNDDVMIKESAATGFDCGVPAEPSYNTPPNSKTDTHERPRRTKAAMEQMHTFFRYGEIRNYCGNTPCGC
ncbi:uncharacterized protein [Dysidea avara]|uniref:uncharacterized protein n=1 Tax=Dysidea avara TaxID=196820 RepID=UPI00332057A1